MIPKCPDTDYQHVCDDSFTVAMQLEFNNNIHLMYALEGNSEFCFPENLNVSRDEVEGNIEIRAKTKFTISRGSIH
jgi:hypothetical protein